VRKEGEIEIQREMHGEREREREHLERESILREREGITLLAPMI
jgi:hypothetical protein